MRRQESLNSVKTADGKVVPVVGKNKINFASGEYPPLISDERVSKLLLSMPRVN